jgi:hypothetical protein
VPLSSAVAWRLWPTRDDAAVLTALLVAASSQVLITGMTLYAMPGHLAFNLLWLWLLLSGRLWRHLLAGVVGVLAVGLHQVNFHLVFVIPVMAYLLYARRWKVVLFYTTVYVAATVFWLYWFEIALWWSGAHSVAGDVAEVPNFVRGAHAAMSLPDRRAVFTMVLNILRFVSWNHLALVPLVVLGCTRLRREPILLACASGIAFTLVAFVVVLPSQGHGWGYRYLHGYIGILALIAARGWIRVTEPDSRDSAFIRFAIVVLTGASACGLLVRGIQVEAFVRPRAEALAVLRSAPADVVVVDDDEVWYGGDLAQNDPYLRNTPKIMVLSELTQANAEALCARNLRVLQLGASALIPKNDGGIYWPTRPPRPEHQAVRDALRRCAFE